jgi:biotin carboxyl carrier protein
VRVVATQGDNETEADVRREEGADDVLLVTIGDQEHRFKILSEKGGRIELEDAEGRVHVVEVVGTDLRVDGLPYGLELRKAPPKVEGAMRGSGAHAGLTTIKPPMPGKIASVAVKVGDTVQAGEVLVILEAMKMQNEIVSPVDGTVKSVDVKEGESIDAKRVICTIE